MADPIVHVTNGVPDAGTGNITTLGQTLLDGANIVLGATSDLAVAAGAAGSVNAHLRSISRDIIGGIVLQGGSNVIGSVNQGTSPWVVSGTVAATQSGVWNITNISGTVSLPTGAATAALQPSNALQASATSGQSGTLSMGATTTAAPTYVTAQTNPLSLTTAGALRVDGSGVTQPVSGTVSLSGTAAVTQSGTWTVQPGNTANTTPWLMTINQGGNAATVSAAGALKVDGSAVTQPVSGTFWQTTQPVSGTFWQATQPVSIAAAVTVQQATAANLNATVTGTVAATQSGNWNQRLQDGAGNAITSDARGTERPLSVQILDGSGNQITTFGGSGGTASNFGSAFPATGTAMGAEYLSTPPTLTSGNMAALQVTSAGSLHTTIDNASVAVTGTFWQATQPVSGTFWQATQPISAASLPLPSGAATSANQPSNAAIGSTTSGQTGGLAFGAVTTGLPSYTTAQSDPLSLTTNGLLRVDGSNVTQPVSGSVSITGTIAATQSGTWNITNISGTVSLPTGAATSANQPTNASLGSTTSGQTGLLSLGAVTTASPSYTTAQSNALSLTTAGALRTDASATTQPISGSVTASQGGTWTVQPGNTANTTPWLFSINQGGNTATVTAASALKVDGSAVTQPVSGTVTANQGGNWTSRVVGNAGAIVDAAQNAAAPANEIVVGGVYNSTAPTITNGNATQLQTDVNGFLKVNVAAGGASGGTSSSFAATFPSTGTAAGAEYLSSPPTLTSGQMVALQTDVNGNLNVNIKAGAGSGGTAIADETAITYGTTQFTPNGGFYQTVATNNPLTNGQAGFWQMTQYRAGHINLRNSSGTELATTSNPVFTSNAYSTGGTAWTSATPANTTQTVYTTGGQGFDGAMGNIFTPSTLSGGAVTFEESYDTGTTWKNIPAGRLIDPSTGTQLANPFTLPANASQPWKIVPSGSTAIRLRLSTAITGAGTTNVSYTNQTITNAVQAYQLNGANLNATVIGTGTFAVQAAQSGTWNVGITGTATISGTVTANQGGAPWSMKPDGTTWAMTSTSANVNVTNASIAVTGTFWQATQPISAASLPLPSGAATSANQPTNAAQASTTSGQTGGLMMGAVTTAAPSYTTAQTDPLSLTTAGALRVDGSAVTQPVSLASTTITGTVACTQSGTWNITNISGTVSLPTGAATAANQTNVQGVIGAATAPASMIVEGGVFNTTKPTLTTGQSAAIQLNSSGSQLVDGSAVTQPVSGTFWQATQPVSIAATVNVSAVQSGNWTSRIVGNTGVALDAAQNAAAPANELVVGGVYNSAAPTLTSGNATQLQTDINGNLNVNIKAGAGSGGTASSFNATFPATGTAAGAEYLSSPPALTSGQMVALQVTSAGSLHTTVDNTVPVTGTFWQATQPVSIASAVTVAQATAANLNATVTGTVAATQSGTWNITNITGTVTVAGTVNAAQSGIWSDRITGNLGAIFDAPQNTAAPANLLVTGGVYNSGAISITSGNASALQLDSVGNLKVSTVDPAVFNAGTAWNSSTTINTVAALVASTAVGYDTIIGQITQTTTITGGQITFEESYDGGTTFVTIPPQRFVDPTTYQPLANPYVCVASTNQRFHIIPSSTGQIRARLSTVIAGTGTVTVAWTLSQGSAVDLTNTICGGDTANGWADGGWPIKIGGAATTSSPTAVSNGQRVNAQFDKVGKLITAGAVRTQKGVQKTSITTNTETTVTPVGGNFTDVYSIIVTNKSATSVFVDFRDSTAGTVRMTLAAPAGDTRGFTVPVDSAMVQATAGNNWTATVSAAVTSIEITMLYVSNA